MAEKQYKIHATVTMKIVIDVDAEDDKSAKSEANKSLEMFVNSLPDNNNVTVEIDEIK